VEFEAHELEHLGQRVVSFVTRYLSELENKPAAPADLDPERLRTLFSEPLPRQPQGIDAVLDEFENKISANSVGVGHPRFFAWTRTSPLGMAVMAESLAAVLNQSVAVWDGAPAATEVELLVLNWLKEMIGYPQESGAILTSGGSIANFVCLLAALSAAEPRIRRDGLYGMPQFTIYTTCETHYCIPKAVEMAGLGQRSIRQVAVDSELRMDPVSLAAQIHYDLAAGLRPLMVAATLGTVNSGACDDLIALGLICREHGIWLHVDGAYGGITAFLPDKKHLAAGIEQVDSLVFDPHKGLYMPFEVGCALVRNRQHLKAAFSVETEYLPNSHDEDSQGFQTGPFHFRDYGPQLSRTFRALKLYLSIKAYGTDRIAEAISLQYELAAELGRRIEAASDFELLAPVPLGIVAFRYTGELGSSGSAAVLDQLNKRILGETQQRGEVFLSGLRLKENFALRACFATHRTRHSDLNMILEEVRRSAQFLS
jgi:aromatic-L-amino-acid/L-tryptophan decarboxylase